jgi:hypothetical protein
MELPEPSDILSLVQYWCRDPFNDVATALLLDIRSSAGTTQVLHSLLG